MTNNHAATHPKASQGWNMEASYTMLPADFYTRIAPTPVKAPKLAIFNHALASGLGLSLAETNPDDLASIFSGNVLLEGSTPIAQAYAGHQFGHFTMLGDGRAHLLGEQITPDSKRYDIQLKGSGQTPYSRRGDGRAALAPMLREYLISEAMHALGISTTRSLAVVTTGEPVFRDTVQQGAILTRVAASHIRVGTFEYAAAREDREGLKALTDYAINRHYPELSSHDTPYLAFLNTVIERQAKLVASWMHVGFIHGVMNTDNMTISGETIDYGPCAFMDRFAMDTVFSSIDRNGRYAFGNQASIAQWNLARFAETLLPLLHEDMQQSADLTEAAIEGYSAIFNEAWLSGMRRKLGVFGEEADDLTLIQSLLEWMQHTGADYTTTFRALISDTIPNGDAYQSTAFQDWHIRWQARLARNPKPLKSSFCLMRANNPLIIPRNQHVEDALAAAEEGNLTPFHALLESVQHPFDETESNLPYRTPPAHANRNYQTFCGT
ncbi:MAG: protein adenylyltransferase SelO [Alphaproteobacteria bacterium]